MIQYVIFQTRYWHFSTFKISDYWSHSRLKLHRLFATVHTTNILRISKSNLKKGSSCSPRCKLSDFRREGPNFIAYAVCSGQSGTGRTCSTNPWDFHLFIVILPMLRINIVSYTFRSEIVQIPIKHLKERTFQD